MRHQRHKRSLGVTVEHRRAMLANMITSLVKHHRIVTTRAKAKEASRLADKMITTAKKNTLHARREIIATLRSPVAAKKLIEELAPLFKTKNGGYTRVLRYKKRIGDSAQMAVLELTALPEVKEAPKVEGAKKKPQPTKPDAPKAQKDKQDEASTEKAKDETLFGFLKKPFKKK